MARIPSWGTVSAAPHEFLVHLRRGEVLSAQQGGSCFRWPGDAVALVDTSVKRLQFTADQVTREKTGVQVTGLAVYRIVEPLLAYRMLDLDQPEAVADILQQMLLGATRRLVANLGLEACLTQRKDALAVELMAEIAPVVSGHGAADDAADRGWGIALDTIEIQDVRVLSETVFSRLQAPYREKLALEALEAESEVRREQARLAHERAQTEERRRKEHMTLEEERLSAQRERADREQSHADAMAGTAQRAELDREAQRLEARLRDEDRVAEAARARDEARAATDVEIAKKTAEAERTLGEARADVARLGRAALDVISDARLQELVLTETLPEVSRAFADSFDRIVVTGASDLSVLGQGVGQVVATLGALGVKLPGQTD